MQSATGISSLVDILRCPDGENEEDKLAVGRSDSWRKKVMCPQSGESILR